MKTALGQIQQLTQIQTQEPLTTKERIVYKMAAEIMNSSVSSMDKANRCFDIMISEIKEICVSTGIIKGE